MKNKYLLILFFLLVTIMLSCDSDDLEYQNELKISQNMWSDFKQSNDNSYKYTAVIRSWIGFSMETTITVENGIIMQRYFEYTSTEGLSDDIPNSELEWTEIGNEIGTHENGTEPLTLDQIYDKAKKEWLIERDNIKTYFETENNGMISICGYVKNNCADDCFIGIKINNIQEI